jgi:hypothetical protein
MATASLSRNAPLWQLSSGLGSATIDPAAMKALDDEIAGVDKEIADVSFSPLFTVFVRRNCETTSSITTHIGRAAAKSSHASRMKFVCSIA